MGTKIQVTSDSTGSEEVVGGSDNRINTSSRSDSRAYYNSRDVSRSYSLVWDDASSASTEIVAYWKNDSTDGKELVIGSVGLNSILGADFEILTVTGTAAGGASATPTNLNRVKHPDAAATARTAVSSPVTGLSDDVIFDRASVSARGHEEFRLGDRVRLGQNDAIAIRVLTVDSGPSRTFGVIFGFYE